MQYLFLNCFIFNLWLTKDECLHELKDYKLF